MTDQPLDRQSQAFRNADPEDRVPDHRLEEFGDVSHPPLESLSDIRLPEDWESAGWDSRRDQPKTLAEAREALEARIADPLAPDGEEVRGAYDGLEDGS